MYFLNKFKAKLYKQVLLQKNEYQIDLFDYSWLKNYSGSRDLQASKKLRRTQLGWDIALFLVKLVGILSQLAYSVKASTNFLLPIDFYYSLQAFP